MSASLIGHSGSSAFRLSTTTVSMSLTGSCFSSESAPRALPSWDSRTRWNNLSGGLESHDGRALGADSEEKHEPVSDIDTVVVDSLKALDPEWPIREDFGCCASG